MHVHVTSKFEKDHRDYVMTSIFRRSRAANSVVNLTEIQTHAFMYVLTICKYEKDPIKNSRENVDFPYKTDTQGQL